MLVSELVTLLQAETQTDTVMIQFPPKTELLRDVEAVRSDFSGITSIIMVTDRG
jgi:hypothetical protein